MTHIQRQARHILKQFPRSLAKHNTQRLASPTTINTSRHFTTNNATMSLWRPFMLDDPILRAFTGYGGSPFSLLSDTGKNLLGSGEERESNALGPWTGGGSSLASYITPKLDLHEEEGKFKVSVELPGIKKDAIKLSVDEKIRRLTISGEIRSEWDSTKQDGEAAATDKATKDGNKDGREVSTTGTTSGRPIVSERVYGSFSRSLILPETVDLSKIKAQFNDGILNVSIPKKPAEVTKTRQVTIEDGGEE